MVEDRLRVSIMGVFGVPEKNNNVRRVIDLHAGRIYNTLDT